MKKIDYFNGFKRKNVSKFKSFDNSSFYHTFLLPLTIILSFIINLLNKYVNNKNKLIKVAISQGCCKLKLWAISSEGQPINAKMASIIIKLQVDGQESANLAR